MRAILYYQENGYQGNFLLYRMVGRFYGGLCSYPAAIRSSVALDRFQERCSPITSTALLVGVLDVDGRGL